MKVTQCELTVSLSGVLASDSGVAAEIGSCENGLAVFVHACCVVEQCINEIMRWDALVGLEDEVVA